MLVMTTIFTSVMQMLPATAYIKIVDVWLIFGQLVPLSDVVLLTAMEYIREGDGSREEEFDCSTAAKLGNHMEEEEEEVKGLESNDIKKWTTKQMYCHR